MPHIIPIKELKNTASVSEMCHETAEPIYITKNGYGDMVIMSMEAFEEMWRMRMIYRDLALSEQQITDGKIRAADDVMAEMRSRYGL